jgi:hypothetical protein
MTDLDQSPAQPYDLVTEGPTVGPVKNYNPSTGGIPGGSTTQIQYNNGGVFGGLTNVQVTARIISFSSTLSGAVPASGGGTVNFLRADGTFAVPPGGSPGGANGNIQYNNSGAFGGFNLSGDATLVPATGVITIANLAVTYAKMQNVSATSRFIGRITAGSGSPEELTGTQATTLLDQFTNALKGVVPGSGGGTTNFLRADGNWVAPGGAGSPGGVSGQFQYNNAGSFAGVTLSGDVTANTSTGVVTIANNAVTTAKINPQAVTYATIQNVSATSRFLGRITAGAGSPEELTGTQATTLLDNFTTTLKGLTPLSGGGTVNFLRADGSWAVPPGGSASPGGASLTLQYNNGGAFGGMSGTAWDDTNRSLVTTGATVTVSHPVLDMTQTWNAAVTFTGWRYNITNLNSNAASLLVDYQVGGVSAYSVRKDGVVVTGGWGGTPIDATKGGTGQIVYAVGDTLYANSTTTLTKLAGNTTTTQKFLTQTGTGTVSQAPTWIALTPAGIGAIATVTPTIQGGYPVWNTTLGTVQDGQGMINAIAYGADPTGVADSKTFIQNALNTGKLVYLPTGTYTISGPLNISINGAGLIGDGIDGTTLQGNYASGDIITVLDGIFFNTIANMRITRTSLGTSGSGINVVGSSTGNDGALLYNLDVFNHNIGLTLGRVTHGKFYNSISTANRSHGIILTGTIMQWQLHDVLSSGNGGDGFRVTGTGSPTPCGQWRGLSTSGNAQFSFNVTNADGLRVADSFFGGGSLGEVLIATASASDVPHHFTNVYCEALKDVNPWQFNSSCITEVHLSNCTGTTGGAGNGIVSAAPLTMITNGAFIAKAGFGASTGSGIVITGARGSIVGSSALGFGGTANIVATGITAISIHACRANGSINTTGTGTVSNVGNY